MNMFKKNGGFTLVELIVVIAILAGVAIPVYSGYITKAKDAAAITELDALQTAVQAANAKGATQVTKITVVGTAVTVEGVTAADFKTNFEMFYAGEKSVAQNATTSTTYDIVLNDDFLDGTSYDNNTGAVWTGKWN